jgi:putative N6-adenine-specific DNA methylase
VEYIKNKKYFAQVTGGFEKHVSEELVNLGAIVLSEVPRGVRFTCDQQTLYRILYTSRLITRVLAPLISFQCHSEKYLYQQASQNVDWTALLRLELNFSIITNVSNSYIQNSLYAGQVLKDAICDQFKNKYNARPNFRPKDGDIVLNLYIYDNWATISIDISGISMHKRGYRIQSNLAPMQETLAAMVIKMSGWRGEKSLYDIMCGSGTLVAEALMFYSNIPAGYLRKNSHIEYMPDFDLHVWELVKSIENNKIRECPTGLIFASDIDKNCVEMTIENLKQIPFGEKVVVVKSDFRDLALVKNRVILCNPPYGHRLGIHKSTPTYQSNDIPKLYNEIGDFLKQKCPKSDAYILCGKPEMISELRLRGHWKKSLKNGDIEAKLVKINIK